MEVFSRTLVGIDGSFASANAVDVALRLVQRPHYHAVRFVSVVEGEAFYAQSRRALDEAVDRASSARTESTCTMRDGDAVDGILAEARDHAATCIVLGARGLHHSGPAVLGKCAEGVLRRSSVPVVVVHNPGP